MAEETLNAGPVREASVPGNPGGNLGSPGNIAVSAEQLEALIAEKTTAECAAAEQENAGGGPGGEAPGGDGETRPKLS